MKVLVYALSRAQGGIENFLYNYCKLFKDITFDFICIDETAAYKEELEALGSKLHFISTKKDGRTRHNAELETLFQNTKYDVAWFNENNLCDILFLKLARKYQIPVRICHAHNSSMNSSGIKKEVKTFIHNRNRKSVFKYATTCWACSAVAANWFYGKEAKKAEVIPNAIFSKKYLYDEVVENRKRKELGIEGKYVIGHVGRFSGQKNHEFLIDIFKQVVQARKNSVLVLIGNGPLLNDMKKKAQISGLEDKVIFLGQRQDVGELLQAFDIFVFPSLYEGMPIAAIEAQAAGLPCVVSDKITREIKVTPNITFLSIEQGIDSWVKEIIENLDKDIDRKMMNEIVGNTIYNIEQSAGLLEERLKK